jgi:ubiquinone/menaquinone biosynthesis C-methylase UbiE
MKKIAKILDKIGLDSKITRVYLENFVKKYQNKGLTLDAGCGTSPYAKYFPNRIGLDITKRKGADIDVVASIYKLPFKDENFDNILCTEVLEHLSTPEKAIQEMKRVLKKGGYLILTTRFLFPLHDIPDDYYRFTKYGLKQLFKDWELIELKEETKTLETLAVLLQRINYQCRGVFLKPLKPLIFIMAKIIPSFSFLIRKEYGDIGKTKIEGNIMTSGYYLVAKKK